MARADYRASPRRHIASIAIIIAALVAGAVAGVAVLRRRPLYQSVATVLVDQPRAVAISGNEGILVKLEILRGKYAAYTKTDRLVTPVAQRLGLPEDLVRNSTEPGLSGRSLLFTVSSRTEDPDISQRIANGVAEEVVRQVDAEQVRDRVPADVRIQLSVFFPGGVGTKVSPTKRDAATNAGIASGLVLLLGFGVQSWRAFRRS